MIKKLLYLIPLLFVFNAYADTRTSGDVQLIKISTGLVDPNRHWGDKLNSNFDIIAATFTSINTRLSGIDTATASITSNFSNFLRNSNEVIASSHMGAGAIGTNVIRSSHMFPVISLTSGTWADFTATGPIKAKDMFISGSPVWSATNTFDLAGGTQAKVGGAQFGGSVIASAFVVGNTTLTAGGGGGSGDTIAHSTFSRTIGQGGDVFLATHPFNAIPGASWPIGLSTITIINVQCFTNTISTEGSTTFNIVRTTESNAALPTPSTIHSSSFTVPIGKRYSPITVPNAITVGNPRQLFSLWITSAPMSGGGGQLPGDYGCTFTYNLRKYDY